jgi:hypothetical protein
MSRVKLCATQSRAIKDRILIRLTLLVQGFVYFYYIIQILGCCDLKECNLQYIKQILGCCDLKDCNLQYIKQILGCCDLKECNF